MNDKLQHVFNRVKYIWKCTRTCIHTDTYTHTHAKTYMHAHMYTSTHTRVNIKTFTHVSMPMHTCTLTYVHTHKHTNIHKHTYIKPPCILLCVVRSKGKAGIHREPSPENWDATRYILGR